MQRWVAVMLGLLVAAAHAAPAATAPAATEADVIDLRSRALAMPVPSVPLAQLTDTYSQARGTGPHEALDIMAPRGTPVVAVEDGRIVKLFTSRPGGLTIYQFDPTSRYAYYYAHLDGYAPDLREGIVVRKGQVIGFVGSTGNALETAPHLHFAIYRLGAEKLWWRGTPVNPYPVWRQTAP